MTESIERLREKRNNIANALKDPRAVIVASYGDFAWKMVDAFDDLDRAYRAQRIRDIVGVQWLEMCGVIWRFMHVYPHLLEDDGGAGPEIIKRFLADTGQTTPLPLRERHRSAVDIIDGVA
jgi:hypothetical protein